MINAADAATLLDSTMTSGIDRVTHAGRMNAQQIDEASKDFESMFVAQMLEQMFGDSIGTEAFGDEDTGEIYKGMMMDAYGKEITKGGGIGVADYIKQTLTKQALLNLQEVQEKPL